MQLRRYWSIILRRWPTIALVVLLAALGGGLLLLLGGRQYTAELRLRLDREPIQRPAAAATDPFAYSDYYRFLGSEYTLDDAVEQIRGNLFARAVLERLEGSTWDVERVQRALRPARAHRVLIVEATGPTREEALRLKDVVEAVLTGQPDLLAPPDGSHVGVRVIHSDEKATSNLTRQALSYALQLLLALLLGIGLAFLLDYLDGRVRDDVDARALGPPLLGALPAAPPR